MPCGISKIGSWPNALPFCRVNSNLAHSLSSLLVALQCFWVSSFPFPLHTCPLPPVRLHYLSWVCLRAAAPPLLEVELLLSVLLLFSRSVMSDSLRPHGQQHTRLPCPSLSPRVCWNLNPLSQWCHLIILSSVIPFSSCPRLFPASGSFPMSWLFHQVAKVLELQHQSFQCSGLISSRIDSFLVTI